jgi:S1-C subfamily serine protease
MKQLRPLAVLVTLLMFGLWGRAAASDNGSSSKKSTRPGWLGVSIQDVTEKIAARHKLPNEDGAYVNEVVDNSPADSAGVEKADVIIRLGDRTIDDSNDLQRAVSRTAPGTKITLVVLRGGEKKTLNVTIGKSREIVQNFAFRVAPRVPQFNMVFGSAVEGLNLTNLNEQLGAYFGAPNNAGVLVQEVERKSAGEKAGFKAGDVIIRAGKRTVEEVEDITREMRKHEEGDKVEFEVQRKGDHKTLMVEIEEDETPSSFRYDHPQGDGINLFLAPHPERDIQLEIERSMPDMEKLNLEMRKMQKDLRDRQGDLKENLRRVIRQQVRSTAISE